MTQGTLVDATIIEAPSSTKNKSSNAIRRCIRRKGNQWHFGMKAHIGADAKSGLTHSLITPRPTSMTSISWVICRMERAICLSRCRLPRGATA
ncbi:transposase [Escherichia coli]